MKIGLDLGASRIKVSFMNNKEEVKNFFISNRIDPGNKLGTSGYLVKYNDTFNRVGASTGYSNMAPNKIDLANLEEMILAVGYQIMKLTEQKDTTITLEVEALLPPKQFMNHGDAFKVKLAKLGVLQGEVNGTSIKVVISNVNVNCEGVALLNILDFNVLSTAVNKVLLMDVGSSTTDLVTILKDGGVWQIGDADTIDIGGAKMCEAIAKKISSEHGTSFEYEDLEKNMSYSFENKEYSIFDKADCLDAIVGEISNKVRKFVRDPRQYTVILAGDGSELLYSNKKMQEFIPDAAMLDEETRLYGNSIGALKS